MTSPSNSLSQTAFKKLRRNKTALAGLACIVISIFVAIFAYWLAPDPTPNANRMILEISGQSPGFTMQFLKLKKDNFEPAGIFQRTISGKPDEFIFVPIISYQQKGDSLVVQQYVDEGVSERKSFSLAAINNTLLSSFSASQNSTIVKKTFWLGTDKFGRDILSRLIIGTRVSLSVGSIAVLISLTLGILLGSLAGFYRGRTDDFIIWFINVIWSIPTLLLVFAITLVLGKGFWQVFIAVGLTLWVSVARIIRGQVFSIRELEYIEATRALGYSDVRTITRHILPNVMGPVMVMGASNFATAIVIEAGLSFLGVGVQPPQPSWGLMIKENYNFIITNHPMLAIIPGVAIMILVLSFNLLGNGLRDALDVRST
jgi:ABC-type dipeptide/oligopeptide/nickel transport system permease subunit